MDDNDVLEVASCWTYDDDKEAWICPYCGGMGEPGYLYCPSCGHVIEEVELWLFT